MKRIGFACKWLESADAKKSKLIRETERTLNSGGTTVAWLNRQQRSTAEQKMFDVVKHNLASVSAVLNKVAALDPRLRMLRLSSDLLPMFTEPTWGYFYRDASVLAYCEREFAAIGAYARANDIRLSFHPGQFCVLASSDPGIVARSLEEFEYHATMARWMGYGTAWHDHGFKINVHISGREGPDGIRAVLPKMSTEARNLITIENDENSWGLEDSLDLEDDVALVLDIHHHWIREGEYIQPNDDRVKRVIDSWRGTRPTLHYSLSREDLLINHDPLVLPDMSNLLSIGYKKAKLRAHSDFYWNRAVNQWALGFLDLFDIMCESKMKNLAAAQLLDLL